MNPGDGGGDGEKWTKTKRSDSGQGTEGGARLTEVLEIMPMSLV